MRYFADCVNPAHILQQCRMKRCAMNTLLEPHAQATRIFLEIDQSVLGWKLALFVRATEIPQINGITAFDEGWYFVSTRE